MLAANWVISAAAALFPPQQSTAFVMHNNDGFVLVKYMVQVTTD
jgi:hypothetical protein